MNVLVMSCSPKKENSITYQTEQFLEKLFPGDVWDVQFTTTGTLSDEVVTAYENADIVLVLSSIFHFGVHGQVMSLFREMEQKLSLKDKPITYLTTSSMVLEQCAHDYVARWAKRNGMNYIAGLSLLDESVLHNADVRDQMLTGTDPNGTTAYEEMFCWWNKVKETVRYSSTEEFPQVSANIVLVDTSCEKNAANDAILNSLKKMYASCGGNVTVVSLRDYNIKPCIGCNTCYTNRKCFIEDEFCDCIDKVFLNTDVIVYIGTLEHDSFGQRYKLYCDRQVQFGRCPVNTQAIILFAYSETENTAPDELAYFKLHEDALAAFNISYHAGYVCGYKNGELHEANLKRAVIDTALAVSCQVMPQRNCWSETLNLQFARIARYIQNYTPADYAYFQEHHWYDEVKANPHIKPLSNYEEAVAAQKSRLLPYNMKRLDMKKTVALSPRREHKSVPLSQRKRQEAAACISEKSNQKKGFGLFRKK